MKANTKSNRCQVCKYERRSKKFKERIYLSNYYVVGGEALDFILEDIGVPFNRASLYRHMKLHCPPKPTIEKALARGMVETIVSPLQLEMVGEGHERALNTIIIEGDKLIRRGKLPITTTNLITAIQAKVSIEKSNKDRKVEMMKALMMGAAPGKPEESTTNS